MNRHAAAILVLAAITPAASGCAVLQGLFATNRAPAAKAAPAPPPKAERVIVYKRDHILEVWAGNRLIDVFPIALGPNPEGPKQREGDGRTPQGLYYLDWRSADTKYHRELHISYPDAKDIAQARAMRANPGGAIFIHGLPPGFDDYDPSGFPKDWTEGCIALSNKNIDKLWTLVADGTPIEILP